MAKNITIDGPSGSGKSTIAKALAKELSITYLDTGAMYRGVAYFALKKGLNADDVDGVKAVLHEISMDIRYKDGEQKVYIGTDDVTPFIRQHDISMAASTISKIPAVRLKLVELQRIIAKNTDCVVDGRDIGSYVLPDAEHKYYMTASPEVRAARRHLELCQKGQQVSFDDVLKDIKERDAQDSNRDFAPLVVPQGAIVIDTTDMTIEQVKALILEQLC